MKKIICSILACWVFAIFCVPATAQFNESTSLPERLTMEQFISCLEQQKAINREKASLSRTRASKSEADIIRQSFLDIGFSEISSTKNICPQGNVPDSVIELAFTDLKDQNPEVTKAILEARQIVLSQSNWAADDVVGFTFDLASKTFEIDPTFSDLFPGWDLPKNDVESTGQTESDKKKQAPPPIARIPVQDRFEGNYAIKNPSTTTPSTPKYYIDTVPNTYNVLYTCAWKILITDPGTRTYNLGYSDGDTGISMNAWMHLNLGTSEDNTMGKGISFEGSSRSRVGVRFSTSTTPGIVHALTVRTS